MIPSSSARGAIALLLLPALLAVSASALPTAALEPAAAMVEQPASSWEPGFLNPSEPDQPWAYWWWVNGNVTRKQITRDLEAMKRQGISGLLMFDSRNYHDDILPPPPPPMEYMSQPWRELLSFAIAEADRLGLKMSINLSSGAGALKGPWDVGDDAPKKLLWTALTVRGPGRVECQLEAGGIGRFWQIAVMAGRHAEAGGATATNDLDPKRTLNEGWQQLQTPDQTAATLDRVIDLSASVDSRGKLTWDVPAGRWSLIRFGCTIMDGHETDVDILSASAVETYFNRLGSALMEAAGSTVGKTLTHLYSVSWEGAAPTWTLAFGANFKQYRGYDPTPYLPALAGLTVQSSAVTERFLRDYYKTLGDCFMDNCYGKLHELSRAAGLKWHSESGGPWNRALPSFKHADQMAFLARNDVPQGEFWHLGQRMNRPPAMAAHIYGKRLAATEAFTHMRPHWTTYPAVLKIDADGALCEGINHFIWHTFTASPEKFGKPGIEYFAGTHFNPNVTWFHQSGPFLKYLARCQYLLRLGHFVADVCCYTGDKPYMHWGRGTTWSKLATLTLGKGRSFDLINNEVLLERCAVEDGDIVLPDGMRYRLLVVDLEDHTIPLAALRKIKQLAAAGATVVLGQRQPLRTPGLRDYPAADRTIAQLASQLWATPAKQAARRSLGKGQVYVATQLDHVLAALGVAADFEAPWEYIHRRTDDADIYFLSGAGDQDCTFRVGGREPELWDPASGRVRDAVQYRRTDDGRTVVPISLPKNGSMFVLFRRPADARHLTSTAAPEGGLEIQGRDPGGVRLHLWSKGEYRLNCSAETQQTVRVEQLPPTRPIDGPWRVRFAPGWGAPEEALLPELTAWNEHAEEGIRFFSGTATYHNSFDLTAAEAAGLVRIQLGQVKNIATVRLNGKSLGIVWTAPWSVDLSGIAQVGGNELEIDVTNLWVNRLIGDAPLPLDQRLTGTNALRRNETVKRPHLRGYSRQDRLSPSGLLGPVRVEFGKLRQVRF
jgi:(4-O-methyl)-D-glucuronate---lignin esterase